MKDIKNSSFLEWSNAYKGRLADVQAAHACNTCKKPQELVARLQKGLGDGTMPFMTMPYQDRLVAQLTAITPTLHKFKHMLILGIGGSALGAKALQKAFYPNQDLPNHTGKSVWIADNIDVPTLEAWFERLPVKETIVVAISKSGGTIETLAQYFLVKDWLKAGAGANWHEHMLVVTDENKGFLREQAKQYNLSSMPVPDNLGGRYSIFSAVGLIPAAFLGIDWQGLLAGARSAYQPLIDSPEKLPETSVFAFAKWAYLLMQSGYSELIFFSYIPAWSTIGPWFAQLWAESLGKEGKGSMPLAAVGATDQHSVNQMFLDGPRTKGCIFLHTDAMPQGKTFASTLPKEWQFLVGKKFGELLTAEALGTRMAMTQYGVPLVGIVPADVTEFSAGKLMGFLMMATIFTGWLMEINPVDQPAVELGKQLANASLGAPGLTEVAQQLHAFIEAENKRQEF